MFRPTWGLLSSTTVEGCWIHHGLKLSPWFRWKDIHRKGKLTWPGFFWCFWPGKKNPENLNLSQVANWEEKHPKIHFSTDWGRSTLVIAEKIGTKSSIYAVLTHPFPMMHRYLEDNKFNRCECPPKKGCSSKSQAPPSIPECRCGLWAFLRRVLAAWK